MFDEGKNTVQVIFSMVSVEHLPLIGRRDGGYNPEDAGIVIGAGISAFCPEHKDKIPQR